MFDALSAQLAHDHFSGERQTQTSSSRGLEEIALHSEARIEHGGRRKGSDPMSLMNELVETIGLSISDLTRVIETAPAKYKVYQIAKRSGGHRTIAHPARELKLIQRYVLEKELLEFPVHPSAMAYEAGRSIFHNARGHRYNDVFLKLDFTNFFPSILVRDWERYVVKVGGVALGLRECPAAHQFADNDDNLTFPENRIHTRLPYAWIMRDPSSQRYEPRRLHSRGQNRPPQFRTRSPRTTRGSGKREILRDGASLGVTLLALVAVVAYFSLSEVRIASLGQAARHLAAAPNCDAARMVGLAPARRGQPGYYPTHDADDDGIACEVRRGY